MGCDIQCTFHWGSCTSRKYVVYIPSKMQPSLVGHTEHNQCVVARPRPQFPVQSLLHLLRHRYVKCPFIRPRPHCRHLQCFPHDIHDDSRVSVCNMCPTDSSLHPRNPDIPCFQKLSMPLYSIFFPARFWKQPEALHWSL